MKEIENDIVKKYQYKDYVVYVKEVLESYECYLQKECYAVIDLMFGINKQDYSLKEFEYLIIANIEDYIEIYKQEYEDQKQSFFVVLDPKIYIYLFFVVFRRFKQRFVFLV